MRSTIQTIVNLILAVAIIAGGFWVAKQLAGSKKELPKIAHNETVTVFTKKVTNQDQPIEFTATGSLKASNRLELFSEVQGVMLPDGGRFKEGRSFKKGQLLIAMNAADLNANLKSQRSNLQSLITTALADIRLDYSGSFDRWNRYLATLDVNSTLAELPEPSSNKEKMFITGRKIYSTFYSIRNMELVLGKYTITAPFNGILTKAVVSPGTVIRPGQQLGTFVDPSVFELETPVSSTMIGHLKVGQKVTVTTTDNSGKSWEGTISRINSSIDQTTQTTNTFIRLKGDDLKEGMFLEADIAATKIENATALPREVLFDKNQVYISQNNELVQKTVDPIYFNKETVIVRGLEDGWDVLIKMPPSAYPGMKISD